MISVYTTVPDEETAERMARELVEERVAACVNYHAVSSVYRWEGHPYDLPAVLRAETEANEAYDGWVAEECGPE